MTRWMVLGTPVSLKPDTTTFEEALHLRLQLRLHSQQPATSSVVVVVA